MEASATPIPESRISQVLIAAGGPAAIGVLLSMNRGVGATLLGAAQLPAIIIGVLLLMAPALYIGGALASVELNLRTIVDASSTAVARAGLVLLGLVPALLFLHASSNAPDDILIGGSLALLVAALVGTSVLFPRLSTGGSPPARGLLFTGWYIVGIGIAASLYINAFLS